MSHLALVLPGSGYGPAGPALLIPRLAAEQRGVQTVDVTYPEWRPGMDAARAVEFATIVGEQVREIVAQVRPTRLTLLAKSLGCEVVARLDSSVVAEVSTVDVIWLTPVFALPAIRHGAIGKGWPSLIVSGDADRWFDETATAEVLEALEASALVIAGADHSLEVPGDVMATLDGLRRVADAVLAFL